MKTFKTYIEAFQFVEINKPTLPYKCKVINKLGVEFDAEIAQIATGLCLSALEPERLWEDLKWKEYQENGN